MKRIARFEKVSENQFCNDYLKLLECNKTEDASVAYKNILLPKRATLGSAGYDFYSPVAFDLKPGESIKIPTGIRVFIEEGWVLKLYPRSGLGFKFRLQLDNTVGIIDSDYYNSDNEGHIITKITNCTNESKVLSINERDRFIQGIFIEYGITVDDNCDDIRNGGFGSTSM